MLEPRFAKRFINIDRANQLGFEIGAQFEPVAHVKLLADVGLLGLDWLSGERR